ncbi:histone-lysine N-methyltransferase eggless [Copidosoma floridanum]|uniref:histone-lysine N-methyltransferase eggless n=1 Tax=Copidosoma floridanum TaxID=29053 RepID=UPI0006C98F74|nr:histone-lysine N-methyltransferase eggless [Copidosoma floridanum]
MAKAAVVIDLDSDDDQSEKGKKKPCNTNCINFKCSSGVDMRPTTSFACSFYGVNMQKKKKRFICKACLDAALDHQEQLVDALIGHKPLLQCDFPDHTMEVEISDSDESDSETKDGKDMFLIEGNALVEFEKKVDSTLTTIFEKYDINFQLEEANTALKTEWNLIDATEAKLNDSISKTMKRLDLIRSTFYNEFKPSIKMLEELKIEDEIPSFPMIATKKVTQICPPPRPQIQLHPQPPQRQRQPHPTPGPQPKPKPQSQPLTPPSITIQAQTKAQTPVQSQTQIQIKPQAPIQIQTQQDNQPEILQEVGGGVARSSDLPPAGQLIRPVPKIDDFVFIMKHPLFPWIKAKIQSIVSKSPMNYSVKLLQKKYAGKVKTLPGKQLASSTPSEVIIPVGTRVVAIFQDTYCSNYYSGVIAEPPKSTNKYRYLVFFDDGYAQYVKHKHIFLVCESSARVWEDIPPESRDFVKKYLESYPERPMVKLQRGQVVKTEWNGKWWIARVREVDASLVQMHFDADNRTEWIYRGSARLGPLYVELMKANLRQQGCHSSINTPSRHRGGLFMSKNGPYVEYTSNTTDEQDANKEKQSTPSNIQEVSTTPQQSRAVAKKSTAKKTMAPETSTANYNPVETKSSHSIVYYQTQNKIQTKKFVPHRCGPKCVESISFTPDELRGYSPLSIPLLCGWNRQFCRFPKGKKIIFYQAPCGVRLRNMEELHKYLRKTNCPMSVDLFEFDFWVHCLAEFVLDKCFVNIKDLSYGVESVAIPCVNEIDHAYPDTIKYTTQREPTDDVHINLDPDFLCSCDCEDDCADKNKCQCWQLTIQGATLGGRVPNAAVGYVYKRLPEAVTTGIYECNSRCKCSVKTCLNRVVQHPLNLKLQVFKTAPRGWGIRCLNDIPLGSFICIYAGRLLTEQGANEGGKNYGDEYLAELDYVEVVEGIKEGYESDVLDPELPLGGDPDSDPKYKEKGKHDDTESHKTGSNDSDDEYKIDKKLQKTLNIDEDSNDGSIRSRLRKRKKDDSNQGLEDKGSEDGQSLKDGQDKAGSDEDDNNMREPSKLDLAVDTRKIEKGTFKSVREFFGEEESVYIMDAKTTGNIGRYLNHSCDPNVFVQNVFVDTHDVRFPWVAFFALSYIRAGQELTWNYSYDVGSIPGKVIPCKCGASNCRGRLL